MHCQLRMRGGGGPASRTSAVRIWTLVEGLSEPGYDLGLPRPPVRTGVGKTLVGSGLRQPGVVRHIGEGAERSHNVGDAGVLQPDAVAVAVDRNPA